MAKRFLIWVAVSSKEQAERVSPDVQADLARQHVARWSGTVVDTLHVAESRDIVLLSDAEATIPAYARLHDYIQRRAFDVLICYDLGRLGRAHPLILAVVELCRRASILVYEIENPPHSMDAVAGYDEALIRALKAVGYQHEVEKFRARARFGREGRAKAGKLPQVPPFGYVWRYDENGARTVEVNNESAAVVRRIITLYLAGSGIISIADTLTREGVPSPSGNGHWQKNSVRVILERAWTYAGYAEYYRGDAQRYIRAPGTWTALIDDATAQRIENELRERAANRRIADTKSRLTSIVICETCGKAMWQVLNEDNSIVEPWRDPRKPGRVYMYPRRAKFYCRPWHRGGTVTTKRVVAAIEVALDELARRDLSAIPDDDADRAAQYAQQLAAHDAAIARHSAALRRADTAYVSGAMDDERYQEQVKRLRAAIEQEQSAQTQLRAAMEADRQRGGRRQRLQEIAAHGRAMLTTPDTASANAWFRQYVRVFVRDNSVTEVRFL